jgi:hypothetical protein
VSRLLFALFLIALPFMADDCTIGNLGDFVVTYDVTVTNTSDETASVSILLPDNRQTVTLTAGAAATVTGFKPGTALVSARPAKDYLAELKKLQADLVAKLEAKTLSLTDSLSLYNQLNALGQQIRDYEARGHGALCSGDFSVDKGPKKHSFTLTFDGDRFACAEG